jgi:hypothetical protein
MREVEKAFEAVKKEHPETDLIKLRNSSTSLMQRFLSKIESTE